MKKVIVILLSLIVYYACKDSEEAQVLHPDVTFSNYLDERDSIEYKCITIGTQTWMAEDLRYRLAMGPLEGCYTYNEEKIDTSIEQYALAASFKARALVAIDKGQVTGNEEGINLLKSFLKIPTAGTKAIIVNIQRSYPDIADQLQKINIEVLIQEKMDDVEEDNGHYADHYGLLYTYEAALKAAPKGWRLPTDKDWQQLEMYLGMASSDVGRLGEWRGDFQGLLLKEGSEGIGFNARLGGGKLFGGFPYGTPYKDRSAYAYFWSADKVAGSDTTYIGVTRTLFVNSNQIMRGTADLTAAYHVRCIKE